jgi:hypothetical protein
MAIKLELASSIQDFILLSSSISVVDASRALMEGNDTFAVIGDLSNPQALIQKNHLRELVEDRTQTLIGLLDRFPPLIMIDGKIASLTLEMLVKLFELLRETKASGFIIYQGNRVTGIISKKTILRALPPAEAIGGTRERVYRDGLYGDPVVPLPMFVCHKCTPPLYLSPLSYEPPNCPNVFSHRTMEVVRI